MDICLLVVVILLSICILPMIGILVVACKEIYNSSKELKKIRRKISEIIDNM